MTTLGWQALLLVPLLLAIWGLFRLLLRQPGDRQGTPLARFLIASILVHVGLLFVLDLILITIPVVEAHRERLKDVVLRTFSIGPARKTVQRPWEKMPDVPPPSEPAPEAVPAAAARELVLAPELKDLRPTIPDATARALPPDRLLFIPRQAPPEISPPPSELPRAVAVLAPDLPAIEPPPLKAVPRAPEPAPPAAHDPAERPVGRDGSAQLPLPRADLDPAGRSTAAVDPLVPARAPDRPAALAAPIPAPRGLTLAARPPVAMRVPAPDAAAPPLPATSAKPPPPVPAETIAPPPRTAVGPAPALHQPVAVLRAVPRLSRPVASLERPPRLPSPRLDVPLPPLPAMRLPAPGLAPVVPRNAPDLSASLSLRQSPARKAVVLTMGGSEASERAVDRGLAWLAAHQGPGGNWSLNNLYCKNHQCDSAGNVQSEPAATGLALLAFLGAGHSQTRGTHAATVRRGVSWLIAHQRPDGDLAGPGGSQMYGHALATIALCEAYGMSGDPPLREPAARALGFIVRAQDPNSGGWRYTPRGGGDTSVVGWQLMALKSGEMAGLPVPAEVYHRAGRWLDAVSSGPQHQLYAYQPGQGSSPAMTAEALLCRQYLGMPRTAASMVAGGDYLKAHLPRWDDRHGYYWYYATQVMYHLQGDYWTAWNSKLRDMLITAQVKDGPSAGSWHPRQPNPDRWADQGGRLYETAVSLLMLEVYYRHLPLYQQLGAAEPASPGRGVMPH